MKIHLKTFQATLTRAIRALLATCVVGSNVAVAAENSFAVTLQNNAMWQANLTKQMINLGGVPTSRGAANAPTVCLPPFELQRGVDGHVPVELQGDPRYQEYLRCRPGQANTQSTPMATAAAPRPTAGHAPIAATDFLPARRGRPVVEQAIGSMQLSPDQRLQLRKMAEELFRHVSTEYRDNNVAVSVGVAYSMAMAELTGAEQDRRQTREMMLRVNDALASNARFAALSNAEKQDSFDGLIFEGLLIGLLREMGKQDPQARRQAGELARAVLKQLEGS